MGMVGGSIGLEREKGKGRGLRVEIGMERGEEVGEERIEGEMGDNDMWDDVIGMENEEVVVVMLKEMYGDEGMEWDRCRNVGVVMEVIGKKE